MKLHKLFLVAAGISAASTLAHAADGTWNVDANGTWSIGANWSGGTIPGSSTDTANFTNDITADRTVTLGAAQTIGNLVFSDNGAAGSAWVVTGSTLTLGDNGATVLTPIINTVTNATIASGIAGNDGLTKMGAGTLTLSGTGKTYTGATNITAGTLRLSDIGTTFVSAINVASGATLELNTANTTWDTVMFDAAAGAITGTGTITKTGTGIFQYRNTTTMRDFAGTIDIQAGTFGSAFTTGTLGKDGSLMSVNVGASGLFDLRTSGANAAKIDKLTGTGRVGTTHNAGSVSTLTVGTAGGSSQFDGVIMGNGTSGQNDTTNPNAQAVALTKVGAGTFTLTGANTYSGATTVNAGTLTLSGSGGAIVASSGVTINGGTLKLDNTTTANNANRLNNAATVTMSGGALLFSNDAGAASFGETLGALSINSGAATVSASQAAVGQTSTLTFASLTKNSGGTVDFVGSGLGDDARNRILFTANPTLTNGIIGAWATYNGGDLATYDATNGIVRYTGYTGTVTRTDSGAKTIADATASNVNITDGSGGNPASITLSAATVNINTLTHQATGGATTVDLSSGSLRLGVDGGILAGSGTGALTITGGRLTAGGNAAGVAGNITVTNNGANAMSIGSQIDNNGAGIVTLVKSGAGTLILTGTNTYTGTTTLGGGTLQLVGGDNRLSSSTALAFGTGAARLVLGDDSAKSDLTVSGLSGSGPGSAVVGGNSALSTFTVNQASNTTFAGNLGGAGTNENNLSLVKQGAGVLTITGNSSYTGTTTVTAGELTFAGTGTQALTGAFAGTGNVTFSAGSMTLSGGGTGGSWYVTPTTGAGTSLNISSGTYNLTNLYVYDGTNHGTIATSSGTASYNQSGGTVNVSGLFQLGASETGGVSGETNIANITGGSLNVGTLHFYKWATSQMNISGGATVTAGTFTFGHADSSPTAVINVGNGTTGGTLAWGTTSLGATRNYTLNFNSGTIKATQTNASWIPGTSFTTMAVQNAGGTIDNGGFNVTIGQVISHGGTGATDGGLTFIGTGTTTLTGANTYTGVTKVTAGTLTAGHASALGSGGVLINGGTLQTSVANVNTGAFTMSSGSLAINGVSAGTVTLASGANLLMSGGTWSLNLVSNTDAIAGSGAATFSITGGTLDLGGGSINYANSYNLITGFSSGSVSGLSFTNYDNTNWAASLSNAGVLSFTAVPEPSTYGLIGAGALAGVAFVRRRRRHAGKVAA